MLRFQGFRIANVTKVIQVVVLGLASLLFLLQLGLVETPSFSGQLIAHPSQFTTPPWDHLERMSRCE